MIDNFDIVLSKGKPDCLNVLSFIQLCCGNANVEFQNYFQDQEKSGSTQNKVSIDIISELVNLLDRLTRLRNDLFYDSTSTNLAIKVILTLKHCISFSVQNQKLLGHWRKLHRMLNFFISQDLENFAPITDARKAKIDLFCLAVSLLHAILKTKQNFKTTMTKSMMEELNVSELINKILIIYQLRNTKVKQIFSLFRRNYDKVIEPSSKIYDSAFDIFMVLLELNLQESFVKALLNFSLAYKDKAVLGSAMKFTTKSDKILKEGKTTPDEELKTHENLIEGKSKGKKKFEQIMEEEDKYSARTDDGAESDISLIHNPKQKRQKKTIICCNPIKPTDGRCKRCCKFGGK